MNTLFKGSNLKSPMSDAVSLTDSLIKDYLAYRGLNQSLKALEVDLKQDKDGKLNVDKIVEEILACIERHDIDQLKKIWSNFNEKVFNSLSNNESRLASQYETDIYRLYLVRCVQKNDQSKCVEFFQKMASLLVNNPQWSEWFAFPYVTDPIDAEPYKKYFLRQWQEIFMISLHNFFSMAIQAANPPWLLKIVDTLNTVGGSTSFAPFDSSKNSPIALTSPYDEELMDDFAVIAQCSGPMKSSTSKPSLKSILKNITGAAKRSID